MEAGRKRLAGDTAREGNTGEVQGLRREAPQLITSPAFVVIKAADEFRDKTTAINQMWQTDFTYIKIVGWGGPIFPPFSTTSLDTLSPGSCAPQ